MFRHGLQVGDRFLHFTSVSTETEGEDADIIFFNLPFIYYDADGQQDEKYLMQHIYNHYETKGTYSVMGMPSVIVTFKEKGITAIERSQNGVIALVLVEDNPIEPVNVYTPDDIPETLTDDNKEQVQLCLMGYQTGPKRSSFIPSRT